MKNLKAGIIIFIIIKKGKLWDNYFGERESCNMMGIERSEI